MSVTDAAAAGFPTKQRQPPQMTVTPETEQICRIIVNVIRLAACPDLLAAIEADRQHDRVGEGLASSMLPLN
jgi:hypothetical protein